MKAAPRPSTADPASSTNVPYGMMGTGQAVTGTVIDRGGVRAELSPRQKAAVIVRLLTAEGMSLSLDELSDDLQTLLTGQLAQMRAVDRTTINDIASEFCDQLEAIGLIFPHGLDDALSLLDGQLSTGAATRLRKMVAATTPQDPWQRLCALTAETLYPLITDESPELTAVIISKLPVPTAAELLGLMPGDRARRIAYAVSQTGSVAPEVVERIGAVLVQQLDAVAPRAFTAPPVERVGAILNQSVSRVRDAVIEGLNEDDQSFADQVRKAIFTFALIPKRIAPADIPKILRGVDQTVLVRALASATGADQDAVDYILNNMSKRLSDTLRDEMSQIGKIKDADGEAARVQILTMTRNLEAAGEVFFITEEDQDAE